MDKNEQQSEEKITRDIASFKNWSHEKTGESEAHPDYTKMFHNNIAHPSNRTNLMSTQEKRTVAGRSNASIIFSGLIVMSVFAAASLQLSKSWYITLIVIGATGFVLLVFSLPWIIAGIRGVPIYSNPPPIYTLGDDITEYAKEKLQWDRNFTFRFRSWWISALMEALQRKDT